MTRNDPASLRPCLSSIYARVPIRSARDTSLALRAVGYEGIYHLPSCGSSRRLKAGQSVVLL